MPQGRVLLCYRPTSSGLLRGKTKRSQFQVAACTSTVFTSHAPASCRAGPVSHSTKQTSCDAGVATSLNPSHSKVSTTKLSEQKRDRSLSLAGDPFCIIHLEFASVVQSLKEQSPNDPSEAATSTALSVTLHHKPLKNNMPCTILILQALYTASATKLILR